jgi:hypothetical protein
MRNSSNAPSPCADVAQQPLGSYLIEAGLLTTAQVDVALNDQRLTGMRFGEVLTARGWVKEQTVEFFVQKVMVPERQSVAQSQRLQALEQLQVQLQKEAQEQARKQAQKQDSEEVQSHSYADSMVTRSRPSPKPPMQQSVTRRDLPISKPLPSLPSKDDDVSWAG